MNDAAVFEALSQSRERLHSEIGKAVVGQRAVIEQILVAMLPGGNCLLTGAPGLAKTLLVKSLAEAFSLQFTRIQFTPDLMPADITGMDILQDGPEGRSMKFVSLTLTPLTDTPEALREYIKQNEMPSDWTFLTGKQEPVERVQRALGFLGTRESDIDPLAHSTMARYCDESLIKWTHVNTLLPARTIARMIRFELV